MDIWAFKSEGVYVVHFLSEHARTWISLNSNYYRDFSPELALHLAPYEYGELRESLSGSQLTLFEDNGETH